jgi:Holliday junction resolvasome RuvABC endonuclease subunit
MVLAEYSDDAFVVQEMFRADTGDHNTGRKTHNQLLMYREIWKVFRDFSYGVDVICAEVSTGSQSASAAKAAGACTAILATYVKPICLVTPNEVKVALTGNREATKEQMIARAFSLHPEAPWKLRQGFPQMNQEHYADAIGVLYAARSKGAFDEEGTGLVTS